MEVNNDMNQELRKNKAIIRDFLRAAYTEANLIRLLDHARSGVLSYASCCCLAGLPTADHDAGILMGRLTAVNFAAIPHLRKGWNLPSGHKADSAFAAILNHRKATFQHPDPLRQRLIIPLILSEIRRRQIVVRPIVEVRVTA